MRIPKVPVRLQRHRAWDPFLCTSSQSRAVHVPCVSALRTKQFDLPAPLGSGPLPAGICERSWEGLKVPKVGTSRGLVAQGYWREPQEWAGTISWPPRS